MDPIVNDLKDLMPDTVSVRVASTPNLKGAKTYGAVTNYSNCFIMGSLTRVTGSDNQERTSKVQVIFPGAFGLKVDDEFTLPSRFTPRKQIALAVKKTSDENGAHHEVVYF